MSSETNQITVAVGLVNPQNVTLHYSMVSNSYSPENVMSGTGQSRYEFSLTGLQPGTPYYWGCWKCDE